MAKCLAAICCLNLFLFLAPLTTFAQANSWTHSGSGHWDDAYWSLGVLPGTNQTILFTNAGSQVLSIDTNTALHFPETLTVDSISISAPAHSSNILAISDAPPLTPLTVRAVSVGSNCAMEMLSAQLQLDGPSGVGLQVGGEFDEINSRVSGQQVNVGYIGPGNYRMIGGTLDVSNLWVGGDFEGVFNQEAGTNNAGIVHLESGGRYNFSGGNLNATLYFSGDSTFHQIAGTMNQPLVISEGTYLQSGGTNLGPLFLGNSYNGPGNYVLSNGYSFASGLNVGEYGTFHQWGGTQILTNGLSLTAETINYSPRGRSTPGGIYWLHGGMLTAGGMGINCLYIQDGGTNSVTGDIATSNLQPVVFVGLQLNGGLLTANNMTFTFGSGLQLKGGKLTANNLTVIGEFPPTKALWGPDVQCLGGELNVSNIDVEHDYFEISGTALKQTGTLTLSAAGVISAGPGAYTFGPLIPSSGEVDFPTNANCQLHFADSSSLEWSNAWLIIRYWSGSIYGGGSQQIFFGSNPAALTPEQLTHIVFENLPQLPPHHPNGLPDSVYYARILATGEIVPDTDAPLPPKITAARNPTNSTIQLSIGAEIGQSYDIEVSTNLGNWTWWTNAFNANGTIELNDGAPTNYPQRFYRVRTKP